MKQTEQKHYNGGKKLQWSTKLNKLFIVFWDRPGHRWQPVTGHKVPANTQNFATEPQRHNQTFHLLHLFVVTK